MQATAHLFRLMGDKLSANNRYQIVRAMTKALGVAADSEWCYYARMAFHDVNGEHLLRSPALSCAALRIEIMLRSAKNAGEWLKILTGEYTAMRMDVMRRGTIVASVTIGVTESTKPRYCRAFFLVAIREAWRARGHVFPVEDNRLAVDTTQLHALGIVYIAQRRTSTTKSDNEAVKAELRECVSVLVAASRLSLVAAGVGEHEAIARAPADGAMTSEDWNEKGRLAMKRSFLAATALHRECADLDVVLSEKNQRALQDLVRRGSGDTFALSSVEKIAAHAAIAIIKSDPLAATTDATVLEGKEFLARRTSASERKTVTLDVLRHVAEVAMGVETMLREKDAIDVSVKQARLKLHRLQRTQAKAASDRARYLRLGDRARYLRRAPGGREAANAASRARYLRRAPGGRALTAAERSHFARVRSQKVRTITHHRHLRLCHCLTLSFLSPLSLTLTHKHEHRVQVVEL